MINSIIYFKIMNHIIDFDANDEWVTNYPVIEIEQKKEEEIIIGTEESFD